MLRTRKYLTKQFETGDVPTGEDYADLIESMLHRSDMGNVGEGVENPVSGDAVWRAIGEALGEANAKLNLQEMIRETVRDEVGRAMGDYVTRAMLNNLLGAKADQTWVNNQLEGKADKESLTVEMGEYVKGVEMEGVRKAMEEAIGQRLTLETLTPMLAEYALKTELPTLLEVSKYALKTELPDVNTLVLKTDYNTAITNLNTAIAAKATAADVATAKSEAIAEANKNTNNVCALRTDFGDDGMYIRNVVAP